MQERIQELPSSQPRCADVIAAERHERFSFAVTHTLDVPTAELQELLDMQSTAERLRRAEVVLTDGRGYMAARSTLRDLFSSGQ